MRFVRGDIVIYDVKDRYGMQHWAYLNGSMGIVEKVGYHLDEGRGLGARVAWISQVGKKESDLLDTEKPYPYYLLTKVGHVRLPKVPHG